MWRPTSTLLLLALTLAQSAVHAAATTISPTYAPKLVVATPTVSGFTPSGSCVSKGSSLTVQGSGFGTSSGKGIALGGSGIHVDLPVSSWTSTNIATTIPNDPKIQGGQWYYIGVEKADHSGWLSNINK